MDRQCDIGTTAKRIAWARFQNAGQSVVAPDYVLCHADVRDQLLQALRSSLNQFYGSDPRESCSFGRLVNVENVKRVKDLLWKSGKVAIGGQVNEAEKYVGEYGARCAYRAYSHSARTPSVRPAHDCARHCLTVCAHIAPHIPSPGVLFVITV